MKAEERTQPKAGLARCRLFAGFSPEEIEKEIVPAGHVRVWEKGEFLFMKGDIVDRLGILLSGRVHLYHIFEDGERNMIGALESPDITGLDLAFTRSGRSVYYAQAAERTEVFTLPASAFARPGTLPEETRAALLVRLLSMVSHDNVRKEYRVAILSRGGLRERVLTYLTMQAEKRGTRDLILPFNREEMASFLCVNRSALSHELSRMRAEGLIDFHRNRFTVKAGGGNGREI